MDPRVAEAVAAGLDLQRGFDDADARPGQLGHLLRAARYRCAARAVVGVRDLAQQLGELTDAFERSRETNGRLAEAIKDMPGTITRSANGETT
jgi:hypothetical protein